MIEIHVAVPFELRPEIESKIGATFKILGMAKNVTRREYFFQIETTEEEATFLALRYGERSVWKR